ncbi:MAG: leucine-rich repeat domain-containing protein, partial [Lachnospiraceae bacterium]|nr:leucine-rich repeat domain-containing protein [Lachnospiraceae bacterium]
MRGIVDIKLPQSLKRIESRAFRNCIGLEQVTFGGSEVQIDEDAFRNCTSLKSVRTCDGAEYTFQGLNDIYRTETDNAASMEKVLAAATVPELVRVIHRQVLGNFRTSGTILLQYLGAESRVVIPEGITRIAEEAFAGIETIDKVILPESLREIGAEAFRGCLLMQTIVLPKGLCRIGAGAFSDCVKLLRIEIPEQIDVLEDRIFRHCRALQEIHLPDGLQRIGESAFYGCSGLKKLQLPESLVFIGKMAFYRSGLREVRIPAGAEVVESLAFARSNLQRAWISGGGHKTGMHYGIDVFGGCVKLKTLVLEEGVCHIPDKFAYGCAALERFVLPKTLESVGRHALEGTAFLEEWRQHAAEKEDEVFWDGQQLEGEVWIPECVRIVAGGAFYGNTKITEVHLTDQVQSIGAAAFKGCKALRRVWMPSGITRLEAEVFSGCVDLEEVSLKQGLEVIGERAFYGCGKLREVCLEQVEELGKEALSGCTALIPSVVNPSLWAGENAFANTMLGEQLENGLHIVGNMVVSGTICMGEMILPEDIWGIAPYAFAGNRAVSKVVFPQSVQWIGEGAFFGCSSLEKVVLHKEQRESSEEQCESERLYRIEAHAFEKCISLKEINCSASEIGEAAFAGCIALVSAQFPQIDVLEKRLFANCASMETCLCEKVREVREFCFSGCKNLRDFDFANIRQIGNYAFEGCENLKYAEFQDGACLLAHGLEDCSGLERICLSGKQGEIQLKEYALSGCTSLQQVVYLAKEWMFGSYADIIAEDIPEMVRLLFHSAFSCFTVEQEENLVRYRGAASVVRIPSGIRRIAAEVFRDAMMLEQVEIPESVTYIGARAFHGTAWMADKRRESPMVVVRDMLLDGSGCTGDVTVPADIRLVCGWAFANGLDIECIRFAGAEEEFKYDNKIGQSENRQHRHVQHKYVQVEEYAFRNCINLRELVLQDGTVVKFTGLADRERELPPLAKQAVMDSLNCFKTDEQGVLMECTGNISRLRLAYGITEIGEGAFQDGNLLTTITFPETVKKIGKRAFAGCKWLREVRHADGVECIGAHAFSGCGVLRCVELSGSLRQIGARAFENCISLEEIWIPEGVEEIPERAFYRCHSLQKIQLPSTLKRIGKEAFAFCESALEIQVPEGVQIGERAFFHHKSV